MLLSRSQWHGLLEKYEGQGVSFSHLLNVAGIIRPCFSFENTARDTGAQLAVNVMGTVNGCDSLLPHFTARYAGHIINIASLPRMAQCPELSVTVLPKQRYVAFPMAFAWICNCPNRHSGCPVCART